MAEHSINLGHGIKLHNTCILTAKAMYMNRIIEEEIAIELHPNKKNREDGF
jgi:hypothetical protein